MTQTRTAETPRLTALPQWPAGPRCWLRHPAAWLLAVAAAFALVQLVLVVPRAGLGWDESLYASQLSPRVPAGFFSAPRARGVTYLIAPVVWATGSVSALRTYLAVASSVALAIVYWPWLRVVRRAAVVPLAALLFAGLWVVGFYAPEAMPNLWVACGAVAAAGWFARYVAGGGRVALGGLAAALAVVALMRPGDAFWLAVPLFAAAVLVRAWRRPALLGTMVGGLALGGAQWIVEAYTGVRPPCVLSGQYAVPVAYHAGCGSEQTGGHNRSTTPAAPVARAHRESTAILSHHDRPPRYARSWHAYAPGGPLGAYGWIACLPPWRDRRPATTRPRRDDRSW